MTDAQCSELRQVHTIEEYAFIQISCLRLTTTLINNGFVYQRECISSIHSYLEYIGFCMYIFKETSVEFEDKSFVCLVWHNLQCFFPEI